MDHLRPGRRLTIVGRGREAWSVWHRGSREVGPRRLFGVVVPPPNFTVRRHRATMKLLLRLQWFLPRGLFGAARDHHQGTHAGQATRAHTVPKRPRRQAAGGAAQYASDSATAHPCVNSITSEPPAGAFWRGMSTVLSSSQAPCRASRWSSASFASSMRSGQTTAVVPLGAQLSST